MKTKSNLQSIAKSVWTILQYMILIPFALASLMPILALLANLISPLSLKSGWTGMAHQLTGVAFSKEEATVIDISSQTYWNGEGSDYVILKLNPEKAKVLLQKIQQDPQWEGWNDSSFCAGQYWVKETEDYESDYRSSVSFCTHDNILKLSEDFL